MRPALAIAAFALSAPLCAQRVNLDEFLRLEPVLQAALQKAGPFVVTVETFGGTRRLMGKDGPMDGPAPPRPRPKPKPKKRDPDDEDGERKKPKLPLVAGGFKQAQGKTSGVVLTSDGWILISRFALNLDPTTVLVTVPGKGTYTAQRAGEDTSRGIALVKIDAEGLPVPTFVAPQDVRVGQWAFALGRTFAQSDPTVHLGIVSAKDRLYGRALQVDAYTSPANYGGAVVDIRGRVLGLAVPLSPSGRNAGVEWYDSGIGFAATIADIAPLLARMKDGQVLQRGVARRAAVVFLSRPGRQGHGYAQGRRRRQGRRAQGRRHHEGRRRRRAQRPPLPDAGQLAPRRRRLHADRQAPP